MLFLSHNCGNRRTDVVSNDLAKVSVQKGKGEKRCWKATLSKL